MEEEKGFSVRDRRRTETSAETTSTTTTEPTEHDKEHVKATSPQTEKHHKSTEQSGPIPEMAFSTFVLSLAASAQVNLGNVPHPETNQTAQNVPAAKQIIDILGILQEKTRGNLTNDEEKLLNQVLFNLRMHFVRVVEEQNKQK